MQLKSIIYDILVEEVRNKKLLNTMYEKWKSESGNEDLDLEDAEWAFTEYMGGTNNYGNNVEGIRNRLSPKKREVRSFLLRYNGEYGRVKFDPSEIGNITSFSWKQLLNLLSQYNKKLPKRDRSNPAPEWRFIDDPSVSTAEKEEHHTRKSKEMWYGDRFKIFDDGKGFRVYEPKTQKDAILFGFYQKYFAKTNFPNDNVNKWCVTSYPNVEGIRDHMVNLWQRYRENDKYHFYFVIDETKSDDDRYKLSALQRMGAPYEDFVFMITSVKNGDDTAIKLDDPRLPNKSLKHIYPQLFEKEGWSVLDELTYTPFDAEKELDVNVDERTRLLNRITEEPGEYEFAIQESDVKEAKIETGYILKKTRSLDTLNDSQLEAYILKHISENIYDVFDNYDILVWFNRETSNTFRKWLHGKLSENGTPMSDISTRVVLKSFSTVLWSKQSESIRVEKENGGQNCGIWDGDRGQWLKNDDIIYEPIYYEMEHLVKFGYFDLEGDDNSDNDTYDSLDMDQLAQDQKDHDEETYDREIGESELKGDFQDYHIRIYSPNNNEENPKNFFVLDSLDGTSHVTIFSYKSWKSIAEPAFVPLGREELGKKYTDMDNKFIKKVTENKGK